MAESIKKITELPLATSTDNIYTIGVDEHNASVKVALGSIISQAKNTANQAANAAHNADVKADNATNISTAALNTAQSNTAEIAGLRASLNNVRSNVGDIAQDIDSALTYRLFVNADQILGIRSRRLDTVLELLQNYDKIKQRGVVITFTGVIRIESWQWNGRNWRQESDWSPYRYDYVPLASEEEADTLIDSGNAEPTVIYYTFDE